MALFNQPQYVGSWFKPKDHDGHLILILRVISTEDRMDKLKNDTVTEFICDVVDLDGDQELVANARISHTGITNKLSVGATNVLGRIGKVDTGKASPAWTLEGFTDADVPIAEAWVKKRELGSKAGKAESAAKLQGLLG